MLFLNTSSRYSRVRILCFVVAITQMFVLQSLLVVVVVVDGSTTIETRRQLDNNNNNNDNNEMPQHIRQSSSLRSLKKERNKEKEQGGDGNATEVTDASPKIVGGTTAQSGEFPWFVNVGTKGTCGGTLVWENVVLTAAHCAAAAYGQVRVGGTMAPWAAGKSSPAMGYIRTIVPNSLIMHPSYVPSKDSWDFALFKIEPVPASVTTPINLNRNAANPVNNQKLTTIGFGDTYFGSSQGSNYLRKVDVYHVPYLECENKYQWFQPIVQNSMVCAGVDAGGKDSCSGDSGGPLIDANKNLVGVTSWGNGCALKGWPGVYARVSGAVPWIETTICQMALSTNQPSWCIDSGGGSTGGGGGSTGGSGGSSSTPSSEVVPVRVKVKYDQHPKEFSWYIKDLSTKQIVLKYNFGSVRQKNSLVVEDISWKKGGQYAVTLKDKFGDGVRNGYMDFYALIGGKEEFVDGFWLDFGRRWTTKVNFPTTFTNKKIRDNKNNKRKKKKKAKKKQKHQHIKGKRRHPSP